MIRDALTTLRPWMVLVVVPLAVHPPMARAQRYHTHVYSEADGLGSSTVRGIAQTPDGVMWFATRAGITSYDGAHYRNYILKDGLPIVDHGFLLVDDRGWLCAVSTTTPIRLSWFDGAAWHAGKNILTAPQATVVSGAVLLPDGRGPLIATLEGTVALYEDDDWRVLLPGEEHLVITDMDVTPQGVLLSTSRGLGTLNLEGTGSLAFDDRLPEGPVLGTGPAENGTTLWVVGRDWIARQAADGYELLFERMTTSCSDYMGGFNLQPDGVGGIVFGNGSCVYRFSPQEGLNHLNLGSGLASGGATQVFMDREGHLWLSSARGVTKIVDWRFASYNSRDGLSSDEVSAVLQTRAGAMILGGNAGLTLWKDGLVPVDFGRPSSRVLDLAEAPDGTVWAAAHAAGMALVNPDDGQVRWHDVSKRLGGETTSILFDDDGVAWAGGNAGLVCDRGAGFQSIPLPQLPAGTTPGIRRLALGPSGAVYAATASYGIFRVLDGRVSNFRVPGEEHPCNNIFAVHEQPDGRVLVGTGVGLYEIFGNALSPVAPPIPRIDRPVYFITPHGDETLWFGTDFGVYRWDGRELAHFGTADGLIGSETNRAAGVIDRRGHLWIGTDRGLTIYRPEYDGVLDPQPTVALAGLQAGTRTLAWRDGLAFDRDESTLSFSFIAPTFGDERRVQFRTWLEGIDAGWGPYESLPTREIRHTHLPAGRYRLHVQSMAVGGTTSPVVTSPWFVVRGVWWKHPGFVVGVVVCAIILFYSMTAAVLHRRYAHELQDEIRLRTAELHASEQARHEMEQEQARVDRLEALGILAGGLAHDFNNLLTVMMGNLSALDAEGALEGEAQAWVRDSLRATERARALTRQLLTFAKGGAPVRQSAAVHDLIHDNAEFSLLGSNLRCTFDLPRDLWFVEVDATQMSQVLNNLLINARQAMPAGGTITIRGRNLESGPEMLAPGRYVVLEFEDRGSGIAPEHLDRIFDPYFSTKQDGTGLGLAISYSIVEKHGGRLAVESTPGQGTTFSLFLPVTDRAPQPVSSEPRPGGDGAYGRILVMDDEPAVRDVICATLTRAGYTVDEAECGEQAVALYRAAMDAGAAYDVVLLDLTIRGGMGGAETVGVLRGMNPDVLAIAASGYSEDTVMADAVAFGFSAQIAKPFRPRELIDTLAQVLEHRARTPG